MPAPTPPVIPEAFAQSGDRTTIPDIAGFAGRASWSVGFPPITMEDKIAGGMPPDGRDVNGALYAISAHAFYIQAGQPFTYDSTVSTAISGYGLGAVVGSSDGKTLWYNISSGNTADPDGAGTNWVSAFTYGSLNISGLTGGTRTLTRLESRFALLILSGTLAANQAIVLPTDVREWRIVNSTTGSFTVTVRTNAGTGVSVPQGGYTAAVGVYGNGTDIFLDVQPVALPIAVTPDPNTLLKRDNVGDSFSHYFNGSVAAETVAVANVLVTNVADGYFRKITLGNFLLQGLNNAALTGIPTAPTAAPGTSNTQVATTAFINPGATLNANGNIKLPGGIMIQWGSVHVGDVPGLPAHATVNITYPTAFVALYQFFHSLADTTGGVGGPLAYDVSSNAAGAVVSVSEINAGVQDVTVRWFAVGTY